MATWKITPIMKKSITERQEWFKNGETILHEIGWRWGEFTVETEDDDLPEGFVDSPVIDMFNLPEGMELSDWSTDDGCWENTDLDEIDSDLLREQIEVFLEDNSIYDLEEQGWIMSDSEMLIDGGFDYERVE
jgi:hypothetical protein